MQTQNMKPDDLMMMAKPVRTSHPMDSSQMLLGLMSLSQESRNGSVPEADEPFQGVITRHILRTLLSALRFRDAATVAHSRRVAHLAVGLAARLGWDPPEQEILEIACLLHDVGKIGIPDQILFKPGKLNPEEANLMALHHRIGIDVMQACQVDLRVIEFIFHAASPLGRKNGICQTAAGEVPQGARILAVADAYDAAAQL